MKLLVDTHCWLWLLSSPERLEDRAREMLSDGGHDVYLSVASVWEITVKAALGKLTLPMVPSEYIPARVAALGNHVLPV